jgi:hypothetical protein
MYADLTQHARAVSGHVLARGRYATFLTVTGPAIQRGTGWR